MGRNRTDGRWQCTHLLPTLRTNSLRIAFVPFVSSTVAGSPARPLSHLHSDISYRDERTAHACSVWAPWCLHLQVRRHSGRVRCHRDLHAATLLPEGKVRQFTLVVRAPGCLPRHAIESPRTVCCLKGSIGQNHVPQKPQIYMPCLQLRPKKGPT